MDREDLEAHVMASRSSRGELFDPGYLGRAGDACPVRQEDLDFQARTTSSARNGSVNLPSREGDIVNCPIS